MRKPQAWGWSGEADQPPSPQRPHVLLFYDAALRPLSLAQQVRWSTFRYVKNKFAFVEVKRNQTSCTRITSRLSKQNRQQPHDHHKGKPALSVSRPLERNALPIRRNESQSKNHSEQGRISRHLLPLASHAKDIHQFSTDPLHDEDTPLNDISKRKTRRAVHRQAPSPQRAKIVHGNWIGCWRAEVAAQR
jgi:hypothetical protein